MCYIDDGNNVTDANGDGDDDFYVLGLVAEGEKPQKQTGGLVVTKDLMGNGYTSKKEHSMYID